MLGDFDRYDCDASTPPVEPNAITEMPVREDAPESTVDDEGLPSSGAPADERLGLAKVDRKQVFAALFDTKKPEPEEPETLGRFRVTGQLGRGGMGTVLEGYDPSLDRKVAIKVLHDKAGGRHRDRLVREAQALAQLSHPNVVQVFETGEVDGRLFIAMELVPGKTLRAWQSEPHGWAECVQIYVQAGRGLAAAHAVDIVHRDFKPANCIVDEQGRVRVLDFGLARGGSELGAGDSFPSQTELTTGELVSRDSGSGISATGGGSMGTGRAVDQRLTQTGTMLGTLAYMAPEQLQAAPADVRSDLYSFCVSLYEALCGQRPRNGMRELLDLPDDARPSFEYARSHASMPRLPSWLRRVLTKGLAVRPGDRFPTMDSLLETIEGHLRARRRRRIGVVVGLGLAATVGITRASTPTEAAGPGCEIDRGVLAGTWDDERRAALRQAFDRSGLAFAEQTHQVVDTAIDRWANDWLEVRSAACTATHIDGVASGELLDRRTDCLDRQHHEASAVVEVFATADVATVAHGPEILAELPEPARCSDPPPTPDGAALPVEPAARTAVLEGYEHIARARASIPAGAIPQARDAIEQVEAIANERSFLPLQLEARVLHGELARSHGRYDEAAEYWTSAIYEAVREGLEAFEIDARSHAVAGLAGRWSKPQVESIMIDEFEAAASRPGIESSSSRDIAKEARARLALVAGDYTQALALYEELRQGQTERGGMRQLDRMLDEASALKLSTRYDDARRTLEQGLADARSTWGEGSLIAAEIEQDLGMLALETGDLDGARKLLGDARAHSEAGAGADSVPVARIRFCQAKLAMTTGAFDVARADLEHVGRIFERDLGPKHEETGQLYNALGVARFFEGDYRASIDAYERAVVAALVVYGPVHSEVGLLHSNLAESRAALGEHERALEEYAEALALMAVTLPPEHPTLATAYKGRGQSLLAVGRIEEARVSLEQALALLLKPPSEPFELADTRAALARALRAGGRDPKRVVELARAAAEGFETLGLGDRAAKARSLIDDGTTTANGRVGER